MPHSYDPPPASALTCLCRALRGCGTACLLVSVLAGCVATHEERWRWYNEDGVLLFARGEYRGALESFDMALTFRPQDPILIYNTGQCYDRLGDVKKAEQYYTYCLQVDAKHGDAQLALVALMHRTGRVNEANLKIRDWLQKDPNSPDAYVADAWRLRQEKDLPATQGRLQQALALDPQNRRALTEMGILYETMGMPERSFVLYERILSREPNQVEIAERLDKLKAQGVKRPAPN